MSGQAVVFEHVWKKFRRGERHDSLRDLIPAVARRLWTRLAREELRSEEFWAVRDVSFSVARGEGLGIIGPNGAGKSTTLKLLTRILRPTRGSSFVKGRVGALIEVAAGFHPELTARENVYLQGAIMGMKRREIAVKFDEIVEFAGVGNFIDTPVKRYSSGMNARLGFSIAAHLNPEVLIIDEILSVGDASFQQRCIERMTGFKRDGVAIVFVSHNLQAVANHFDRGLLIDHGACLFLGSAIEAVGRYTARRSLSDAESPHAPNRRARVVETSLHRRDGSHASEVEAGEELRFVACFEYATARPETLIFGFYVTDAATGLRLYHVCANDLGFRWKPEGPAGSVTIEFTFSAHLLKGAYHVNCYVSDILTHEWLHRVEPAAHLMVTESFSVQGFVDLEVRCQSSNTQGVGRASLETLRAAVDR